MTYLKYIFQLNFLENFTCVGALPACMFSHHVHAEGTRPTPGPELKMAVRAATLVQELNPGSPGGTASSLKC